MANKDNTESEKLHIKLNDIAFKIDSEENKTDVDYSKVDESVL